MEARREKFHAPRPAPFLKAFQPLVEFPVFFYRGFTIGDFGIAPPHPPETDPTAMPRGCLELQFGNFARLGQSISGKT